jgi:hypothetical protein
MARLVMLTVGTLVLVAMACGSGSGTGSVTPVTSAPFDAAAPTDTPSPTVDADLLALRYGADWPELYSWRVNDVVEFQFAYPAGTTEWPAPITIWHIPTNRTVSIGSEGRIVLDLETANRIENFTAQLSCCKNGPHLNLFQMGTFTFVNENMM